MTFIRVIPCRRTPHGLDVFDYAIDDDTTLVIGDLILVPLRQSNIPALVTEITDISAFAERAVRLDHPLVLEHFNASLVSLIQQTATYTFSSQATVLHAWLRQIPKRMKPGTMTEGGQAQGLPLPFRKISQTVTTIDRVGEIKKMMGKHSSRRLIITPWKHQAERIGGQVDIPWLHADVAMKSSWNIIQDFLHRPDGVLVTTRIGAWLAHAADVVIIDEPENDDHKQDELAPRYDARWIVEQCHEQRPEMSVIEIQTTPRLHSFCHPGAGRDPESDGMGPGLRRDDKNLNIPLRLSTEGWSRRGRSSFEALSENMVQHIQEAVDEQRPVAILHPIRGERSRIACRDCSWIAVCSSCSFVLSIEKTGARCHRCGHKQTIPSVCPTCGSAQLGKSRIGKDRLAQLIQERWGSSVTVLDIHEANLFDFSSKHFVIITDVSLLGGGLEDVHRRERLIITWRRLAADISRLDGSILAQGPEEIVNALLSWLDQDGLKQAWQTEGEERRLFNYPPATRRIKYLIDGQVNKAEDIVSKLKQDLGEPWIIDGPWPVPFRSYTRVPRNVIHLIPPSSLAEQDLIQTLTPYAKNGIIDLDPISFFS